MSPTVLARRLEQAARILHEVREALAHEPAEAEPVEPAPTVDSAHRELVFGGKRVRLTWQQVKLAGLLLENAGSEVGYSRIDEVTRGRDAPGITVNGIQALMARFRKALRRANLADLAAWIHPGAYRSYVWEPAWNGRQQMSTKISKGVRPLSYTSRGAKRRKEKI